MTLGPAAPFTAPLLRLTYGAIASTGFAAASWAFRLLTCFCRLATAFARLLTDGVEALAVAVPASKTAVQSTTTSSSFFMASLPGSARHGARIEVPIGLFVSAAHVGDLGKIALDIA